MKIVGVAACTSGIAHTYIAKEKLIKAAKSLGHDIWIETQGTIGVEDALTTNQIRDADVVVLTIDIQISGKERFAGKKVIEIPTGRVIKSPVKIIQKIAEMINEA